MHDSKNDNINYFSCFQMTCRHKSSSEERSSSVRHPFVSPFVLVVAVLAAAVNNS